MNFLSLSDFRTYGQLDVNLEPGITVFVGANGIGKTNIVEAVAYLATLSSHRVSSDAPLIRFGAERALIRARLARGSQESSIELEINAGRANRARVNRGSPVRARDVLGICRTVLFAPEDLSLVKGDPAVRRRFLDDLMVILTPHLAATRSDYERVLKQRNALLKSARGGRFSTGSESTLDVWDQHMAAAAAALLHARFRVLKRLQPYLRTAYAQLTDGSKEATGQYQTSLEHPPETDGGAGMVAPAQAPLSGSTVEELTERYLIAFKGARKSEIERGLSLVGPHRDDLHLSLGGVPAKGFASHGESWSMALSLRIGSYYVLLEDDPTPGAMPILILDDVFAELDLQRRAKLAAVVATAEQVLITAAVAEDVPKVLNGRQLKVISGGVSG